MNVNTNTIINNEEEKNAFIAFIEKCIAGTASYVSTTIETRQMTISIKGYGISIGRQTNGSYGVAILMGDKRKEFTFKSIKDALIAFKDFIMKAWNDGKANASA